MNGDIKPSDWLTLKGEWGVICKNRVNCLGLKGTLNPLSTWDAYIFSKVVKDQIVSKIEGGHYERAWISEAAIVVILAIVFQH